MDITERLSNGGLPTVSFQLGVLRKDITNNKAFKIKGLVGILTEDLTHDGERRVYEMHEGLEELDNRTVGINKITFIDNKGSTYYYLLDAIGYENEENGKKYILPDARIDLP